MDLKLEKLKINISRKINEISKFCDPKVTKKLRTCYEQKFTIPKGVKTLCTEKNLVINKIEYPLINQCE